MPDGIAFLAPACAPELREVAEALGEDVGGLSDAAAAERAVEALRRLMADIGIPPTLRAYGLDPAAIDIPVLVKDAMQSRNIATNPRPVGEADLAALYATVIG
jgi:alcohol dehydrogenase class IV